MSVFFTLHIGLLRLLIVVCSTVTAWVLQYAKAALQSSQHGGSSRTLPSSTPSSTTISPSSSDHGQAQSSAQAVASPSNIESQCTPTVSKRAKLFTFMSSSAPSSSSQSPKQITSADVDQQFALFSSDDVGGQGIGVFNEKRFRALRPLARTLFTAPASSAASERAFSNAGLIIRPNRSRLSMAMLSKLVFMSCNEKLDL